MIRSASAHRQGDLKAGRSTLSTAAGTLSDTHQSLSSRFETGAGTNPEELIAAAHAGFFSMALSGQLAGAGLTATQIRTSAELTLERLEEGWTTPGCTWCCGPWSRERSAPPSWPPRSGPRRAVPCPGCTRRRSAWTRRWSDTISISIVIPLSMAKRQST